MAALIKCDAVDQFEHVHYLLLVLLRVLVDGDQLFAMYSVGFGAALLLGPNEIDLGNLSDPIDYSTGLCNIG